MRCPICGGDLIVLSELGNVTHYRCRHCGADFSQESVKDKEETCQHIS